MTNFLHLVVRLKVACPGRSMRCEAASLSTPSSQNTSNNILLGIEKPFRLPLFLQCNKNITIWQICMRNESSVWSNRRFYAQEIQVSAKPMWNLCVVFGLDIITRNSALRIYAWTTKIQWKHFHRSFENEDNAKPTPAGGRTRDLFANHALHKTGQTRLVE